MDRPSWDEYFMSFAVAAASRSTCSHRQVGAVIVKDRNLLASGYNGAPSGLKHCEQIGGCLREQMNVPSGERHELCRGLHAEQNAVIQAAKHGTEIEGATLYCTTFPCSICTKILINAGIKKVYYKEGYADELAAKMLEESDLEVIHLP